jgi:hypothetical protein
MEVDTQLITHLPAESDRVGTRARAVGLLGLLTIAGGVVWAILQPYRITLLHPHGQGFWFLAIEPPLLVIAAGIVFAVFVARPLAADIEEADGGAP